MGHEAHHLPLSSAGWSYISAIPVCLQLLVPTSSVAIKQCDAQSAKHHVKVTTLNSHPCAASIKILDFRACISGMAWTWVITVTFTHPHGCIWSLKLSIGLLQKCGSNLWLLESWLKAILLIQWGEIETMHVNHMRTEVQEHTVTFGNRILYCDNDADSTVWPSLSAFSRQVKFTEQQILEFTHSETNMWGCIMKSEKVKLSLWMVWRHIKGKEVQLHAFLALALGGGEFHSYQAYCCVIGGWCSLSQWRT